jgi:hypothetical protein
MVACGVYAVLHKCASVCWLFCAKEALRHLGFK